MLLRNWACFFIFQGCFVLHAQNSEPDLAREPVYTNLKKALKNADKAYTLRLCDQQLSEMPAELAKLTELRALYLDSNNIQVIAPFVKDLQKLRVLSLDHNQVTEIPPELLELNYLKKLYLSYNKIEVIPQRISSLFSLQHLTLHHNQIKMVPVEVGNLSKMTLLDLSSNQITQVPDAFSRLGKMQRLSLAYNQIKKLPPHFHEMRELEILYLAGNQLSEVDSNLFSLNALEVLELDSNRLTKLPPGLGKARSLEKLYLEKNKLDSVPAALGTLYELKVLNIENNPITYISPVLKDLRKLKRLYINQLEVTPMPAVLFDINRNGTEIKGLKTKDFYEVKILASRAKNKKLTGNYSEAIPIFEEVLLKDTNNADALSLLAICYLELGGYEKAAETCKKALKKDPLVETFYELQLTLGNAQNRTNKSSSANLAYEEKIRSDPGNVTPLMDYAKYLYMQQKFGPSNDQLLKAFKISPNYPEINFYIAINHLSLKNNDAFVMPVLRYILLEPKTLKTKTVFPFVLGKTGLRTGQQSKKGTRSYYYDSYIVRDEDGKIIYKTENPKTDLLGAMLSDISIGLLKNSEAEDDTTKEIIKLVTKLIDQNNVDKLKGKIQSISETSRDSIAAGETEVWDLFIPYYKAMVRDGQVETFSYIINAARQEEDYITKWLKQNPAKAQLFYDWDKKYIWKK